jgi:hypothetical protein
MYSPGPAVLHASFFDDGGFVQGVFDGPVYMGLKDERMGHFLSVNYPFYYIPAAGSVLGSRHDPASIYEKRGWQAME